MQNNNRVNVLEVINLFHSAKVFIGGQFAYLNRRGFKMHLICSPADDLSKFAIDQGIYFKAIRLERQLSFLNDLKALVGICKYIRHHKIEIIIGHQAKARLLTVLAARLMKVPNIIIFAHGVLFETSQGIKRKLLIAESRFESLLSHKVVCVSKSVANTRVKYGIDKDQKQVILGSGTCGGIDTKDTFNPDLVLTTDKSNLRKYYNISDNDLVIGFVGRFVNDKGLPELVESFELIRRRNPNKSFKLMLVGEPEKRDSISDLLNHQINNDKDIIITGFVKNNISHYYSIMDIFVLPSYREGFPTAVLEASSMRCPVITTKSTGCIDSIIENETGIFVKIEPNDICNGIEKLFDKDVRVKMGDFGRKWVISNYDHSIIWPSIHNLLNEIAWKKSN